MHVTDYEVKVEADQAEQPPAVFVKVRLHHVLTGVDIERKAVKMIHKSAEFDTTFEIEK
jgi:uncharacterized OsmC-like protein